MKYFNLFLMTGLSFVSMYILMYAMVDQFANVYFNLNQIYMAGLMTMPMLFLELIFMGHMYPYKKLNKSLMLISIILFISFFIGIRRQIFINDKEFLKSMIPHHAGALLMCKHIKFKDPELQQLCKSITESQQREIDFMKTKLSNF